MNLSTASPRDVTLPMSHEAVCTLSQDANHMTSMGSLHNYVTLQGGWVGSLKTLRNVRWVGGWVELNVT